MTDATTTDYATRTNRSQRAITVDNFLRKVLRVSDPRNPDQVANALLARYPEEADRDRRERSGESYASPGGASAIIVAGASAGSTEVQTARDDLERDLATVTTLSQLKDIQVEMNGWGRAIRQAAADGLAAARLSLDAVNRDSALAARRTLSEYARLARYVGAMSDGSGLYFRRLAQSCDVLGALILVAIGDGLAASGITRSTAIVRVSASELQTRRNAVVVALRSLTGAVDAALGQSEYPRGIVGYQMLVEALESGGQADLRALLEENTLASAMDQLVDLTTGSSINSLRELSTTGALLTQRFTRLAQYCQSVPVAYPPPGGVYGSPESPPLLSFGAALQLFVNAFDAPGSDRLLYIARPPILAYGLYNNSDNLPADRLLGLTVTRGNFARAIDCFAGCGCDTATVRGIVLFDFVLAMLDRAIDLLAVGTDENGTGGAESRAVAVGLLADQVGDFVNELDSSGNRLCVPSRQMTDATALITSLLADPFGGVGHLDPNTTLPAVRKELSVAYHSERQTESLVRRLAPGCGVTDVFGPGLGTTPEEQRDSLVRLLIRRTFMAAGGAATDLPLNERINLPQTADRSLGGQTWGDFYHEQ